jgi:hypothetical protein
MKRFQAGAQAWGERARGLRDQLASPKDRIGARACSPPKAFAQ